MDSSEYSNEADQPSHKAPPHLMVEGLINPSHVGDVLLALRRGDADRLRSGGGGRLTTWAVTVIIACLALGFMGSIIQSLGRALGRQQNITNTARTAADYAQSVDEDVGKLLADPQTKLVRLTSPSQLTADAAIAWNEARRDGALFCDKLPLLPASQSYEIWAIGRSDKGAKVVEVRPAPGVSIYPFHYSDASVHLIRFEVTAGAPDATRPPALAGTVQ